MDERKNYQGISVVIGQIKSSKKSELLDVLRTLERAKKSDLLCFYQEVIHELEVEMTSGITVEETNVS